MRDGYNEAVKRATRRAGVLIACIPVCIPGFAAALVAGGCASFRGARLYQSGTAALDRGDAERAIYELERAAALAPQASEVRNHLGLAYAAAGRPRDALRSFERAVALDCGNEAARRNLAVARSAPGVGGSSP